MLPNTAFASPHAPNPCDQNPAGRQWFGLTRMNPQLLAAGVQSAAPALNQFLDAELARHSLPSDRLALVGFSQGTMMSLHVGLRRQALAAILGYSGLLALPEYLPSQLRCRPPVLLIHGDADMTLPVEATYAAAETLAAAGVPVQFHICEGLGHGIDQAGLGLGLQFLQAAFAGGVGPREDPMRLPSDN